MSRSASPTLIGLFVLGAIAIAIAGAVAFGGGKLFTSKITYVAYFEGSVSGLAVGSPVEFRGVRVGSVSSFDLRVDTRDATVRIPVYLDIQQDRVTRVGGDVRPGEILDELIEERGLKAQLQTQSIVTGQLVVNLDFHPEFPTRFEAEDTEYPEIPTIPSNLQQIQQTARDALAKLSSLPLEQLVKDLQASISGFSEIINSPEAKQAVANANRTLEDLHELVRHVDEEVDVLAADAGEVLAGARATFEQAQTAFEQAEATLQSFEGVVADDSSLNRDLTRALGELAEAARAVRILADTLERSPEALLRGKGRR